MSQRKSISKKIRFEVFKRDSFKCVYCGSSAPDVMLEIDHIQPVSKGGDNNIINLVTACNSCNNGKSNKTLNENATVTKQKQELDTLNKKREQLKLMQKWRQELLNYDNELLLFYEKQIHNYCTLYTLNEVGKQRLLSIIKKYSQEEILYAIDASFTQYYNAEYPEDTWNKAFNMIVRIIENKRKKPNPVMKEIYYARGILRNTLHSKYFDDKKALIMLIEWVNNTNDINAMMEICKNSPNWSQFRIMITNF